MFRNKAKKDERAKLVEDARKKRAERERRRNEKAARARDAGKLTGAATVLQRLARGVLTRRRIRMQRIQAWEQELQKLQKVVALMQSMKVTAFQPPAQSVASLLRAFLSAQDAEKVISTRTAGDASADLSFRSRLADLVPWLLASVKSNNAKCNILACGHEVIRDLDRLRPSVLQHIGWSESMFKLALTLYVPDSQGPSAHVLDTATPEKADVAIESLHQVKRLAAGDVQGTLTSLRLYFLAAEDTQVMNSKNAESQDVAGSYDRYSSARRSKTAAAAAAGGGGSARQPTVFLQVSKGINFGFQFLTKYLDLSESAQSEHRCLNDAFRMLGTHILSVPCLMAHVISSLQDVVTASPAFALLLHQLFPPAKSKVVLALPSLPRQSKFFLGNVFADGGSGIYLFGNLIALRSACCGRSGDSDANVLNNEHRQQVTMAWIRACQHALRQAPKELLLSAAPYLSLRNGRGTVEGVALQQMFVSQIWGLYSPTTAKQLYAAGVGPAASTVSALLQKRAGSSQDGSPLNKSKPKRKKPMSAFDRWLKNLFRPVKAFSTSEARPDSGSGSTMAREHHFWLPGTCRVSDRERIQEFCNMLVLLLCNFGNQSSAATVSVASQHSRHTRLATFLNTMTFNTAISRDLWEYLDFTVDLDEFAMASNLDKCLNASAGTHRGIIAIVAVACFFLGRHLLVIDEIEIRRKSKPLALEQLARIVEFLKVLLVRVYLHRHATEADGGGKSASDAATNASEPIQENLAFSSFLLQNINSVLANLFERHARQPLFDGLWDDGGGGGAKQSIFAPRKTQAQLDKENRDRVWNVPPAVLKMLRKSKACYAEVLRDAAFLIPFKDRLEYFEKEIACDKAKWQGGSNVPVEEVIIRRTNLFQDAFSGFTKIQSLKRRLRVFFVDQFGNVEAGQDVGGLFKELWTQLSNLCFNPAYALFCGIKGDSEQLYPNSASEFVHGREHLAFFEFLGAILGKALFEGIVVQPTFAHFFLRRLLGKHNFLDDLQSLDDELYSNLIALKTMDPEDIEDMGLDFTVSDSTLGKQTVVDLVPGGSHITVNGVSLIEMSFYVRKCSLLCGTFQPFAPVWQSNRFQYIQRVADYYLTLKGAAQTAAFLRGLRRVVSVDTLKVFSEPELQVSSDRMRGAGWAIQISDSLTLCCVG
eukprot:INCI17683.1.p1 GENE.INCI17683.1~~INCI17683.1.p1  ORF type:complete len:1159 (+),score=184.34 INCI17683.1:231-3707(+)